MAAFNQATLFDEFPIWKLFSFGPVKSFYRVEILQDVIYDLRSRGYIVHEFDCEKYETGKDILRDVSSRFNFEQTDPGLDGFDDSLWDLEIPDESGLLFVFKRFDSFYRQNPAYAISILDIFARHYHKNFLFGKRFLVLIQTDDPLLEIDSIGAFPVSWNDKESTIKSRTN